VATVSIDPSVSGQITVSTNVSGIRNGSLSFTPNTVKTAQSTQIALLRQGYEETIAQGFNATIGTTSYTFGWSTDDKANLSNTQQAIDQTFLTFPIQYSDIHGNPVTLSSQTDLNAVEQTATKFFNAQHQQILTLIGQVQTATTVSAVQAIVWSAATY
jgi:hypothetical protein